MLSRLDDEWAGYSERFIERMAGQPKPWLLYHCTRGAHFDNYPHEKFRGKSPSKHPYKDTIIELDDIVGRLVREARGHGPAREHARVRVVGQRPRDGDLARRGVHAVPLREGLDLGRRRARARRLSWPGMIEPRSSDGLFAQLDLFATFLTLAGVGERVPSDRYVDAIDQTSFLLAPDGLSNRKFHYYWLTINLSASASASTST